ncbi:3-oxoacyl-ACP synthase [Streptomyces albireticuli]|uniref:3-oxoacyl-ACP synthase n=1 Tax=Streptomyces albireticuli TaxID=1940 RepID=A0A1Z2KXA0_9ACTN|nr:hypothetical protein [Streptomyces albireticuli]ARZ66659.1 3-oxoacyl-ACP synthase [Streptomyces albireticuli]
MTQVLITGMGAVSCLGAGVPAMWRALCAAPDSLPERAGDPGARMPLPLIHMAPAGPGSGRADPAGPDRGPGSRRRRRAGPRAARPQSGDPQCPVPLPEGKEEPLNGSHVMVNAFAFGGSNVSLVLEGRAA